MNGEDQFEKRLRHVPQRPVPGSWREEILSTARQAARPARAPRAGRGAPRWAEALLSFLWPHPKAWAGLAAIWVLVFCLNFAARDEAPRVARQTARPSPQMRELLHQQERLFAELIGPMELPKADLPKPLVPQPHSQRREQFLYT